MAISSRYWPGVIRGACVALTELAVALRVGDPHRGVSAAQRMGERDAGEELTNVIQRLRRVADWLEAAAERGEG